MGLLRLLPEALSSRRSFYLAIFCIAVMVAAVTAGPPRPMRKHNMAQKRSVSIIPKIKCVTRGNFHIYIY